MPQRRPLAAEFVPADYFRRLERSDLVADPERPLEVDLGCGDGRFLLALAAQFPQTEYLGVERLLGRVEKVSRGVGRKGLGNCRVLRLEIDYTVRWLLPAAAARRIHMLCPDPWPKKRHHKNRVFQPDFLEAVAAALEPGGEFLFMTDHAEYFAWSEEQLEREKERIGSHFERLPWEEGDFFYPKTSFQLQWEALGKPMGRIRLSKR